MTDTQNKYPDKTLTDGLVSVIMPMHNSSCFLREAIESVQAQTYPDWELLIVDDASTDESIIIAREYEKSDSRIHLLINDNPIGIPSSPRNVGLKAAKGRYITFLDSDDLWFSQKLEQQLPFFSDNRTAIVFSNYEKIDEKSTRANRVISAPAIATYKSLLKGNVIGNLTGIYDTKKVGKAVIPLNPEYNHENMVKYL